MKDHKYSAQQIIAVLDSLDKIASDCKTAARRRHDTEEFQWQFYRNALFHVSRELHINWTPKEKT